MIAFELSVATEISWLKASVVTENDKIKKISSFFISCVFHFKINKNKAIIHYTAAEII
jgi:hypothetical protein